MIKNQLLLFILSLFSALIGIVLPFDISMGSHSYLLVLIDIVLYLSSSLNVFLYLGSTDVLRRNPIRLSTLFTLGFVIVFFQIPIEFVLNYDFFVSIMPKYVFTPSVFMIAVGFATISGISLNLGLMSAFPQKSLVGKHRGTKYSINYNNLSLPFFIFLASVFFLLYVYVTPIEFFLGGYSYYMNVRPEAILQSDRFYGYFVKMLLISNAIFFWQSKRHGTTIKSSLDFIKIYPKVLLILQLLSIVLTLMIGDRGGIFVIAFPLAIMYFSLKQQKIGFWTLLAVTSIAAVFFSVIKITQIDFNSLDIVKSFTEASERLTASSRMNSLSPYTFELAYSFYAYTCAWALYLHGHLTYGLSLIMHLCMSIPYLVTLLQSLLGLSIEDFNQASALTLYSGIKGYGIGTDVIGSIIIDLSPIVVPFIFFIVGRIFAKLDEILYKKEPTNFLELLIGIIISSNVFALSRGSIYNLLGSIIFCVILVFIASKMRIKYASTDKTR